MKVVSLIILLAVAVAAVSASNRRTYLVYTQYFRDCADPGRGTRRYIYWGEPWQGYPRATGQHVNALWEYRPTESGGVQRCAYGGPADTCVDLVLDQCADMQRWSLVTLNDTAHYAVWATGNLGMFCNQPMRAQCNTQNPCFGGRGGTTRVFVPATNSQCTSLCMDGWCYRYSTTASSQNVFTHGREGTTISCSGRPQQQYSLSQFDCIQSSSSELPFVYGMSFAGLGTVEDNTFTNFGAVRTFTGSLLLFVLSLMIVLL